MYLTNKNLNNYYVIDIETDGLDPTRIWCIVVKNIGNKDVFSFTDRSSFHSFINDVRATNPVFVGHNALSFDIPALNKLFNAGIASSNVIDTLVLSYLYDPRLSGGHSLEAWGERLKYEKGDFSDWSKYSPEMLEYCIRDVNLTEKVFLVLTAKLRHRGFSEKSCALEHQIREVVNGQQQNGFYFNITGAQSLLEQIRTRQQSLSEPFLKLFPPRLRAGSVYRHRVRLDGSDYASYTRHLARYPKVTFEGDDYTVWDWEHFNVGSPQQRLRRLQELAYDNYDLTDGGQPKVDEEGLLRFLEAPEAKDYQEEVRAIANWLVCEGRGNMIEKWISCVNPVTGCIHGDVYTCGARTRRMTHSNPNTANIPKAKAKVQYGIEARGLWTARPGRVLVGYDAKGLEMRTFAHYVGKKETADLYIHGDPHAVNATALGVDRDPTAKTLFYGFIYGAQDPKLGKTVGKDKQHGAWIRSKLFDVTPGLRECIESVQGEFRDNGGWLSCIDGGFVRCPSAHAALNYKCQPMGALIMKQASIFLKEKINERGFDALKVGDIHDEGQVDCDERVSDEVGRAAIESIRQAGEELNSTVPMDGEYKIGRNWSETH